MTAKRRKVGSGESRMEGPGDAPIRARILDEALTQFAYNGFHAISTNDIAKACGCSQSVVMYHFDTKLILWQEAMRVLFGKIDAKHLFDRSIYKDLDALARLRVLLRRFVMVSARHPELGKVITRESIEGGERLDWLMRELATDSYSMFATIFTEGIAAGSMKDYPPELLTLMTHGAAATVFNLTSLSRRLLEHDPFDDDVRETQADMIVDILLDGLAVRSPDTN
ncbi:MAG: TetR/AcrR family transcriptional regulator [Pontixanthobacter sp.]